MRRQSWRALLIADIVCSVCGALLDRSQIKLTIAARDFDDLTLLDEVAA
jgi:hypothetical protein